MTPLPPIVLPSEVQRMCRAAQEAYRERICILCDGQLEGPNEIEIATVEARAVDAREICRGIARGNV